MFFLIIIYYSCQTESLTWEHFPLFWDMKTLLWGSVSLYWRTGSLSSISNLLSSSRAYVLFFVFLKKKCAFNSHTATLSSAFPHPLTRSCCWFVEIPRHILVCDTHTRIFSELLRQRSFPLLRKKKKSKEEISGLEQSTMQYWTPDWSWSYCTQETVRWFSWPCCFWMNSRHKQQFE